MFNCCLFILGHFGMNIPGCLITWGHFSTFPLAQGLSFMIYTILNSFKMTSFNPYDSSFKCCYLHFIDGTVMGAKLIQIFTLCINVFLKA